jgi:hypothetical protein
MWILSGNGRELVNLEHVHRIFIASPEQDCFLIGADFGNTNGKCGNMGKYNRDETAREELANISQALMDERDIYYMAQDNFDAATPRKVMDSRVKRRGGS